MRGALIAHVVALVLGLSLAYSAWRSPDDKDGAERQVLIEAGQEALTEVAYKSEKADVLLTPYGEGEDRAWAVKMVREVAERPAPDGEEASKQPAAEGDEGPDAGPANEPEPELEPKTFLFPAGRSAVRSVEKLAPLEVKRTIEEVPAERLEAMGLTSPEATLTLTVDGERHRFEVGAKTYGGGNRYLRSEDGNVHLVSASALRGLEGTEVRMAERRVVPLALDEIGALELTTEGRSARFLHQDREQPKKRHLALEGAPEERSEEAAAALTGLRRLRAQEYLRSDDVDLGARPVAAQAVVEKTEGGSLPVTIYEPGEGRTLVKAGRWIVVVSEGMGKELIADITAAVP